MLVSGRAHKAFAEGVARHLNIPLSGTEIENFSDGEIFVKYDENVRGEDLFIIQPTYAPTDHLMELL
ncbi:MAG: ribose-phosphate pyrophosphokinase-like domain-containing protein, partial [Ignavibacteria bacterium]|nr:ribose-phosphate pyrophosphokinase-like domain-containing protein [Ignavibacteria bacterium]